MIRSNIVYSFNYFSKSFTQLFGAKIKAIVFYVHDMVDFPTSLLSLGACFCSFFYQFVFPGSWHFDIGVTSNIDEVLHVKDHEHVELPLVLALDMLLIPG